MSTQLGFMSTRDRVMSIQHGFMSTQSRVMSTQPGSMSIRLQKDTVLLQTHNRHSLHNHAFLISRVSGVHQ